MTENLEDLLLSAADDPTKAALAAVTAELNKRSPLGDDVVGDLDFLFESWSETVVDSDAKTAFTLDVARLSPPDSPVFRNALNQASRRSLPSEYTRRGALNHIGMRDQHVSIAEILKRCENLKALKEGNILYDRSSRQWLTIDDVDLFSFSVRLRRIDNPALISEAPVAAIVADYLFFAPERVVSEVIRADRKTLSTVEACLDALKSSAVTPLDDALCREILFNHLVPDAVAQSDFETWYRGGDCGEDDAGSGPGRPPAQARGVSELRVILGDFSQRPDFALSDQDLDKVLELSNGFSKDPSDKDLRALMEALAIVVGAIDDDALLYRFGNDQFRGPFLPPTPQGWPLRKLEAWGRLKSGEIGSLFRLVIAARGADYAATFLARLPLKCLNAAAEVVGKDRFVERVLETRSPTADLILWLWRNGGEAARGAENLGVAVVIRSLAAECPKSWQPARRELRKTLIGKSDFQKFLLEKEPDPKNVINAVGDARALSPSDQQSLMVKFARHSAGFRAFLENGEGKRALAKSAPTDSGKDDAAVGPTLTSFRSYRERMGQLNEIINKKMPENTAAIAHARSYGDLRENAEYKAAKEEEGRLIHRRAELEADVMGAQPTRLRDVDVGASTVIGSTVEVELDDGTRERYHLAGAWDGNPERRIVSYVTRLGRELVYKKKGDAVSFPDGGRGTIALVESLPDELIAELDDDDG